MKLKTPVIGGICKSTQGRDEGRYYIICAIENDVVYVTDGNFKKLQSPKKKNVKHLYLLPEKSESIGAKILDGRQVFDTEIYSALKSYNYPKPDSGEIKSNKE